MIRAVNIVLIVAIALQIVGCSTWRPLARVNNGAEDDKQSSMREQVIARLTEGMRIRLKIRDGAETPIKFRVFECVIGRIGQTSLTVTPITFFVRSTTSGEFALQYTDIASIEYREDRGLSVFFSGFAFGALFCFVLITAGIAEIPFD